MSRPFQKPLTVDALNNTSIINRVMDTIVGVWDLEDTRERAPESLESYTYKADGTESVCGSDERTKVHPSDFAEGGKYRSIVKLMLHYEGQGTKDVWSMGTGWLIAPDLLVTAGHCSYDWTHKLGKLTKVKAFIGYNGKQSIDLPTTQFRSGKRVACPAEWLKGPTMTYDVSFILLDRPFTGVTPIRYADTPAKGNMCLGVVGYPGDLERGEHMYEHFMDAKFDLADNGKMLTYEIDTFGGNSGSAVLRQKDLVSIGVHAYGGALNKASVIGPLGNMFSDFITAIISPVRGKRTHQGIHFQTIPTGSTAHHHTPTINTPGGASHSVTRTLRKSPSQIYNDQRQNGFQQSHCCNHGFQPVRSNDNSFHADEPSPNGFSQSGFHPGEEGFFDDVGSFFKKGIRISAPILSNLTSTVSPFLGPIGGPIGCLASVAFNAAGKACAESMGDVDSAPMEGLAERAVMGEAALQVIMKMDKQTLHEEGLFDVMSSCIRINGPLYKQAAPQVLNTLMPTALNVAVGALGKAQTGGTESFEEGDSAFEAQYVQQANLQNVTVNAGTESFADGFISNSNQGVEEGFFDVFVKKAFSVGSNLVKKGLPVLIDSFTNTESFDSTSPQPSVMDGLAERAVLQEAALEAIMTLPPQQLQEEGFFDTMASIIKTVAPVVIKSAPGIIKAVSPVVSAVVGGGAPAGRGGKRGGQGNAGNARTLRKKKSAQMVKGGKEESFLDNYQSWAAGAGNGAGNGVSLRVPVASY